jgi:bacillithiol biosynthesis cysteine-adding enzyme BshC
LPGLISLSFGGKFGVVVRGRVAAMSVECYPITVLPHISQLYRDYLAMGEGAVDAPVRGWYGVGQMGGPFSSGWMRGGVSAVETQRLADALKRQSVEFGAGAAALANIEKLRAGARAVVTGQQVGLLGGPLLTLLKAATAVARAKQATKATGVEHVPIFWLATEDHDLEEVDQVSLLAKTSVETLRAGLKTAGAVPVGGVEIGPEIESVLAQADELLGYGPVCELLRLCYEPREGYSPTLGGAFARLMAHIFAEQGLIVMDAAGREFHALGARTFRFAIEHAEELETALLARTRELVSDGYHAQVLVAENHSLLFLIDGVSGERAALRRLQDGGWKAGSKIYSTAELLAVLEDEPERISPNALLRPVFQDTILPTAAYIGGPAEIAYFAQSAVVYEAILGRVTPVLPRLSATLVEPAIETVMAKHEVSLPDAMMTPDALALRLGARAMPIEGKRRLAAVGNAMDAELSALTDYMGGMDESLGRSATVSGNKMRYQMNRLRRMAATFEVQKEVSLRKHAEALTLHVFPDGHPQERVLAGVWFLSRYGDGLVERMVDAAENLCPGHVVIKL